jgi:hypothetical protein
LAQLIHTQAHILRRALARSTPAAALVAALLILPGASSQQANSNAPAVAPRSYMAALAAATSPFNPNAASTSAVAESTGAPGQPVPVLLPDAPTAVFVSADAEPTSQAAPVATLYTKSIPAGWQAQPLTAGDKVVVGLRDLYSLGNFGAIFISAGYAHVTNGQPNFGTDKGAFGQRLGASAIRETAEGLFTDAVFSPLLHQDPRYYVQGPESGFVHRTLYAITRPLIGRTDSGRSTINGALLLGYAGSAALTTVYYPQSNRNFHDVAATYGGSIGGAALGFAFNEFSDQVFLALHLKKPM